MGYPIYAASLVVLMGILRDFITIQPVTTKGRATCICSIRAQLVTVNDYFFIPKVTHGNVSCGQVK